MADPIQDTRSPATVPSRSPVPLAFRIFAGLASLVVVVLGAALLVFSGVEATDHAWGRFVSRVGAVGVAALALCAAAAYVVARRITRPLRALLAGATRAAQGDFETPIQVHTGDELEDLAKSFNHMVAQIRANQQAVRELNQSLEEKVHARTEDLSRMNDALRKAYAELTQVEAQVITSEKMASLGQLVAGISHEINTPSSAIHAATVNIIVYLDTMGRQLRMLLAEGVPPELEEGFFAILHKALATDLSRRRPTTAEVRQQSRLLEAKLTRYGLRSPRELSLAFTRLGLGDEVLGIVEATRASAPAVGTVLCLGFLQTVGNLSLALNDIRISTEGISRMVRALKSYARTEKARKGYADLADMSETDVHDSIENAITLLQNQIKYGIVLERRYADLPAVICNSDELNQVWTNIIHNAIQAMKGVGRLTIETYPKDDAVAVRITDTGPGIPPEIQGRIFDPFFTTKDQGQGSGLGLGIAQQIVERHQGRIEVESERGWTSFEVVLPLHPRPVPA